MSNNLTVAELKRLLVPGKKLILLSNWEGDEPRKRKVKWVTPTFVFFTGDGIEDTSRLRWPKAKNLEKTGDGFKILHPLNKVGAVYQWVKTTGAHH